MNILNTLQSRYSTKVFNPEKKIPLETLNTLLNTIRLSPSSINSQPWHVYVVQSDEERRRLAQAAWDYNQPKYINASHLFVFCAKTDFTKDDVIKVETLMAKARNKEIDASRVELMGGYVENMPAQEKSEWLKQQIFILLGQFLTTCAVLELDACPIEGFLNEKMDELLGLEEKGLTSVVTVAVGYRSEDDFNDPEKAAKGRFGLDEILTIL